MAFSNRIDIFNLAIPTSGVLLEGKIQLTSTYASTGLTLSLYAKSDTTYSNTVVTTTVTTDANGDADISMDFGSLIQQPGTYVLRVTRTSGSPALTALNSPDITVGALGTLVGHLESVLCGFVDIERFEEPAMGNVGYNTFRFGYANWTSDSPLLGEKDEADIVLGTDYKVNYTEGWFYFTTALQAGHDVRASYKFNVFDVDDYASFFARALADLNGFKPETAFTLDTAPQQWLDMLVLGAYMRALDCIALKLSTFKWRRVFDDPASMLSTVLSQRANAYAEWWAFLPKLKRRGYVQPVGISSLKGGGLAYTADSVNWQNFVIGG